MSMREKAGAYRAKGFNCAQSLLAAGAEYMGIDEKTALAIGAGLGGGAKCGELCGCVSSGIMVLGGAFPGNDEDDNAAKDKISSLTKELVGQFREKYGSLRCYELKKAGYPCNELILDTAELVEQIINENRGD